jgi:hypothetical protein
MFFLFGLFLTILDIRDGWIGAEPWHDAIWSAAFSFVGICGLGAIVWSFPLLYRRLSLSQIAESNRRPRQSFAEMIHTDSADLETGDDRPETDGIISSDKPAD